MKKQVFKKSPIHGLSALLLPLLLSLLVLALALQGLSQTEASSRAEGLRLLEDSLRRAAITCYAIEGSYPENVEHLQDHYGVHIDESRYGVHYDIFASNILPDITVIELAE